VLVVGCMLVESLMRPVRVVVPRVLRQDRGGVAFVVDQDAIGALAAHGAHEPLGITVRPGSARRRLDDRDALTTEHGVEAGGELGVSVPDKEAKRAHSIAQIHSQVASVWVPNRSSIRGDLGIFADQFTEQVVASEAKTGGDAVMIDGRGRRVVASAGARLMMAL
jgi:hypothetical protein